MKYKFYVFDCPLLQTSTFISRSAVDDGLKKKTLGPSLEKYECKSLKSSLLNPNENLSRNSGDVKR